MPRLSAATRVRIGALAFVALAIAATTFEMARQEAQDAALVVTPHVGGPLAAELERCKTITPEMEPDATCERAWAENRRRFFAVPEKTPASSPVGPVAP